MTKAIASKGYVLGSIMLAVSIPTNSHLISFSIAILIVSWLLEADFSTKVRRFSASPIQIAFFFFYALHGIALLYTTNLPEGLFNLEKKLSILIFPLVLGTSSALRGPAVRVVFWSFIVSCFLVSVVCLTVALHKWVSIGDSSVMFYDELLSGLGFQAVYFGMYLVFACVLLMMFLPTYGITRWRVTLIWFGIAFFFLFTILLSARMAMLVMVVVVSFQGYRIAKTYDRGHQFIFALVLMGLVSVILIWRSDFLSERMMSIANSKLYFDPKENNANGLTLRIVKWQCSIESSLNSPVFGVGPGDCQEVLQDCYRRKEFWGAVFEYNSHNQYLQTLLGLGLVGLLTLLFCLIGPLWAGKRSNRELYAYFVFLMGMSFLTESMLERRQGIIFYSFFSSLIIFREAYPKDYD